MEENNQTINCIVESCKFHKSNICTLKSILVGSLNNNDSNPKNQKETLCKSFKLKNK